MNPVEKKFKVGNALFSEGEPAECLYLIQSGSVSVRKRKADGHIELAKIYSGEVVGELSFFDRKPRSATVIALTEVRALEIQYDSLEKIFEGVPPYIQTIIRSIVERLRVADEIIRGLQKNVTVSEDADLSDHGGGSKISSEAALEAAKTLHHSKGNNEDSGSKK